MVLVTSDIFVEIILRVIGGFKRNSERIIEKFKSIMDLSLYVTVL